MPQSDTRVTTLTVPTARLETLQSALYAAEMRLNQAIEHVAGKIAVIDTYGENASEDDRLARVQYMDLLRERTAERQQIVGLMHQIKVLI
jgi:hypothetical protein